MRSFASCNLHICLPMLPYDRWQWHTHTHTCEGIHTSVCVHCSSRQMTVEWQRANKTHVKNRTCNEQNKPQRQRERERDMKREGQHRRRRPAWLYIRALLLCLSLSLSFVAWKFPQFAKKSKAAPIWANLRRICHPRCREQRERETKRETARESKSVCLLQERVSLVNSCSCV